MQPTEGHTPPTPLPAHHGGEQVPDPLGTDLDAAQAEAVTDGDHGGSADGTLDEKGIGVGRRDAILEGGVQRVGTRENDATDDERRNAILADFAEEAHGGRQVVFADLVHVYLSSSGLTNVSNMFQTQPTP